MAIWTSLRRSEAKAASFGAPQAGRCLTIAVPLLLPVLRRTASVGNLRNAQRCEGDRNLSQQSHRQGLRELG